MAEVLRGFAATLVALIFIGVVAYRAHNCGERRSRARHPAGRKRRPRPQHRGRRLPERVIAGLTDAQWPGLEERLLYGELYDPVGERIAGEHDRNVAEMPEIDGGSK